MNLAAIIRKRLDYLESMQDYEVSTDTVRCWIDQYEYNIKSMRYKDLVRWVNEQFEQNGINDYEAVEAGRTYHRSSDIEAGACRIIIYFKSKKATNDINNVDSFLCYYSLKQLNFYLKKGNTIALKFDRWRILRNTTIEIYDRPRN